MSNKTLNDSPAKTASARKRLIIISIAAFTACALILLLVRGYTSYKSDSCRTTGILATRTVQGNGHVVTAEVAEDEQDKIKGLSGRDCLQKDHGMLFPYALTGDYCFWMKDMRLAIDMIWLDDEKKIITLKEKVSPGTYPQEFCPDKPAQYILEVNAGAAEYYGWQVGTTLSF